MAGSFTVQYRDEQVQEAMNKLGDQTRFAISRALNRSAVSTRTFMQRKVASDTKLAVGVVRDQMRVEQARPVADGLRARIIISGARVPLFDFKARQVKRGVTADTGRGRKTYQSAFIAQMKSGHRGVFRRKSKKRLPIVELFGPSLPHVFAKHIPDGLVVGEESLQKNLAHEIDYAIKQSSST